MLSEGTMHFRYRCGGHFGSFACWLLTSVRIPFVSEDRLDQLRVHAQLLGPCPRDVPWVSSSLFDIVAAVVCDPTACALLVGQGVEAEALLMGHARMASRVTVDSR